MQDLQEVTQEVHYENYRSERLAKGAPVPPRRQMYVTQIPCHVKLLHKISLNNILHTCLSGWPRLKNQVPRPRRIVCCKKRKLNCVACKRCSPQCKRKWNNILNRVSLIERYDITEKQRLIKFHLARCQKSLKPILLISIQEWQPPRNGFFRLLAVNVNSRIETHNLTGLPFELQLARYVLTDMYIRDIFNTVQYFFKKNYKKTK